MRIRFLLLLPVMAGILALGLLAGQTSAADGRAGRQGVSRTDEEIAAQEKLRDERYNLDKGLDTLGIRRGMTVAEIGAGDGYLVLKLARRIGPDGKALAEDIAARFLDTLKRRAAAQGLANIETVVGETADPRLPRGAFDMVFMHATFHFIEEPAGFFATLRPALKPDGKIVVIEPEGDTFVNPAGQPVEGFPSRQDYLDVFERAGLRVVGIDDRTMPHYTIFVLSSPETSADLLSRSRSFARQKSWVYDHENPLQGMRPGPPFGGLRLGIRVPGGWPGRPRLGPSSGLPRSRRGPCPI